MPIFFRVVNSDENFSHNIGISVDFITTSDTGERSCVFVCVRELGGRMRCERGGLCACLWDRRPFRHSAPRDCSVPQDRHDLVDMQASPH